MKENQSLNRLREKINSMAWYNHLSWGRKRTDSDLAEAEVLEKIIYLLKAAEQILDKRSFFGGVKGWTQLPEVNPPLINLEQALRLLPNLEHQNNEKSRAIFTNAYYVGRNHYYRDEIEPLIDTLKSVQTKKVIKTDEYKKLKNNLGALIASMEMMYARL